MIIKVVDEIPAVWSRTGLFELAPL